jgi:hypothetical protein
VQRGRALHHRALALGGCDREAHSSIDLALWPTESTRSPSAAVLGFGHPLPGRARKAAGDRPTTHRSHIELALQDPGKYPALHCQMLSVNARSWLSCSQGVCGVAHILGSRRPNTPDNPTIAPSARWAHTPDRRHLAGARWTIHGLAIEIWERRYRPVYRRRVAR